MLNSKIISVIIDNENRNSEERGNDTCRIGMTWQGFVVEEGFNDEEY